ncbi:MAG: hypothetical protein IPP72_14745 [Chitinophagaceae bacterium]|nr:hypothetical protein [Chitinophagaceae bacterium]
MPEGGTFIASKLQQLGFKAVDIFGKGIAVKGNIVNSKKQPVAAFSSVHNGMGTVWLTPGLNEKYTAVLNNGLSFQLPIARQSGTQLQVTNKPGADSIEVLIDASADIYDQEFLFRASAKGISCAMGIIRIKHQPPRYPFLKKHFPPLCAGLRFTTVTRYPLMKG